MTKKTNDEPLSYFDLIRRNLDQIEANFLLMQKGISATLDEIQELINERAKSDDQRRDKK